MYYCVVNVELFFNFNHFGLHFFTNQNLGIPEYLGMPLQQLKYFAWLVRSFRTIANLLSFCIYLFEIELIFYLRAIWMIYFLNLFNIYKIDNYENHPLRFGYNILPIHFWTYYTKSFKFYLFLYCFMKGFNW